DTDEHGPRTPIAEGDPPAQHDHEGDQADPPHDRSADGHHGGDTVTGVAPDGLSVVVEHHRGPHDQPLPRLRYVGVVAGATAVEVHHAAVVIDQTRQRLEGSGQEPRNPVGCRAVGHVTVVAATGEQPSGPGDQVDHTGHHHGLDERGDRVDTQPTGEGTSLT